jgi:hypothetical protein
MTDAEKADIETQIAKLQAAEDIRNLKARYAAVCDSGYPPERMAPLFTEDAVLDAGEWFGRHEGNETICRFYGEVSKRILWALHFMIAPLIEVADDLETATGNWYLWQPCTLATDDGPRAVWLAGTYADQYRREDGVWRFSEQVVVCEMITPVEVSWVQQRFLKG